MCVEISLDQPVVGKLWFQKRWFIVEYKGLHLLCKNCGIFRHMARDCAKLVATTAPAPANNGVAVLGSDQDHASSKNANPNPTEDDGEGCDILGEMYGD